MILVFQQFFTKNNKYLGVFTLIFLASFQTLEAQDTRPRRVRSGGGTFMHIPRTPNNARTGVREVNRSIDGTCNNITNNAREEWGASDIALYREMNPQYGQPDR